MIVWCFCQGIFWLSIPYLVHKRLGTYRYATSYYSFKPLFCGKYFHISDMAITGQDINVVFVSRHPITGWKGVAISTA